MRFLLPILLLFLQSPTYASGWGDYRLSIDPDYDIVRCNALDVVLATKNNRVILGPHSFPKLGPIIEYCVTSEYIFTHHYGRLPRNAFAGDSFEEVDASQSYFCITNKQSNSVAGPFDRESFTDQQEVVMTGHISWQQPRRFNFFTPLVVVFCFMLLLLGFRYFKKTNFSSRA